LFDTGELKTAKGYESSGGTRSNENFVYVYDAAGNLNFRGNNSLGQTFHVTARNELTSITRIGTLTVVGTTTETATNVTVNNLTATRYADNTFSKDGFTVTNGNNTFTAVAQDASGRSDTNQVMYNLPATVSFQYDLNGNLTSDGNRGFDYDDENQLIRVTVTNSWKSEFTYDGKFRRRVRKESSWVNSTWVPTAEFRYIQEGAVVIQERSANNLPAVSYTRGIDLSGSFQGAGGIGSLLARSDQTILTPTHAFYHGDGNGNVTTLINVQQTVVARYAYDPFGNTLSKSGLLADANSYRFSSQEYHQNSGLLLYLYRAYDPNLQRWLSRDPIVEFGGVNLFAYVGNNPISMFDPFGLYGNRVSGPEGPVGPASPYVPGGAFYVPTPLPPPGPVAYVIGGVVVGVATAAVVVVGAPIAVAGLIAVGLAPATATATVTVTVGVAGALGGGIAIGRTVNSAINNDWNTVAFNAGTIAGGGLVGIRGGGRFLSDNMGAGPSSIPYGANPFLAEANMGFSPNFPGGTFCRWLAKAPTPASGGASATGIAGGAGLLLQPLLSISSSDLLQLRR
jgi:RHS repeat-associated protein